MEYRTFGQTGMQLSAVALGSLLARYEGLFGQPSPEERGRVYLRAAEFGINPLTWVTATKSTSRMN